jgi:hypothetical protein
MATESIDDMVKIGSHPHGPKPFHAARKAPSYTAADRLSKRTLRLLSPTRNRSLDRSRSDDLEKRGRQRVRREAVAC